MMNRKKIKAMVLDLLCILAGSAIYAVSVNAFTAPNNIAPGGMTGVATMLNYMFSTPIGMAVLVLNIPIIIWGIMEIGYKLVAKTLLAIIMSSICIDLFALFIPAYRGDAILVALFAGIFEGIGLSLVFIRGATTGGTDLIARLINHRLKHLSMGKIMLAIDGLIVVVSAFVYGSIENAMYACIVIFVATSLIDSILYGVDVGTGKIFYVLSGKNDIIGKRIMEELDRGVTYINARGGYSNESSDMLLCAVRRYEVYKLNTIIRDVDKDAFVIVGDAGEISGEGFKPTKSDDKPLKELIRGMNKSNKNNVESTEKDK